MSKKDVPVDVRPWASLTPREKMHREKSLNVLREMRRTGNPLSGISLPPGITVDMVVESIRGALRKKGSTWIALDQDTISRGLNIIENGKLVSITVNDSWEASKVGKYRYAVGRFQDTGDTALLEPFKDIHVRDSHGKLHSFETDPKKILEVLRRQENGTYEVYQ